jgi:hypothetical protein
MKTIKSTATIEAKVTIELSESEARALNTFSMFGAYDDTIKFINERWGDRINKKALEGFFNTAHGELSPLVKSIDEARKALNK